MIKIDNKEKLLKKLFWYKSIFFKFTKFYTDSEDNEILLLIGALNIKNRYKRVNYIVEEGCNFIDNHYSTCNLCQFHNNRCICYRKKNILEINGCCRKCIYQSNKGCLTANVACKLFYCSYANNKNKINFDEILLFRLLNPYQRFILKNDYFASIKEVSWDLYGGVIFLLIRLIIRYSKILFFNLGKVKK